MQVTYQPDKAPPPLDQALEVAAESARAADKPIRLRLQPDLYNYQKGQYGAWSFVSWGIDLESIEDGRALREGLAAFLRLIGQMSLAERLAWISELRAAADAGAASPGPPAE